MAIDYNLPKNNLGNSGGALLEWCSGNLRARIMLSVRYAERSLNAFCDNNPHFYFGRHPDNGECLGVGSKGLMTSHAVGRAMDLILGAEKYTGISVLPEVEAAYVRHFYDYLDKDWGMCVDYTSDSNVMQIELHSVRESIEAFGLLIELRDDERARKCVEKLFSGLEIITDKKTGTFDIQAIHKRRLNNRITGSINNTQPQAAGRLTGPLMQLYRVTGDNRALEYAGLFASGTLDCFGDDGAMLRSTGTHVHSTTSALSGAADYAVATNNIDMIDKLIRIFECPEGMPLVMSSYGWIKEQIHVESSLQGEANQFGDVVQLFLFLGDYEFITSAKWYSRAELFMRSSLLPAQVLETGFVNDNSQIPDDGHMECKFRMAGGYGFPMPASHLQTEGTAIDTLDVTQGATQAIYRLIDRIAVRKNGSTFINFYFDHENSVAMVYSALPKKGEVTVIPKIAGNIYFRIPDNINRETIRFTVDGYPSDYTEVFGWAKLIDKKRGDVIRFTFEPKITVYKEVLNDTEYTVKKYGEQVVSVTPIDGIYPMFYDFTL